MVIDYTRYQPALSAQQKLAVQLLQPLLARRRPSRVLVMKLAGATDLPLETAGDAQVIRLSSDDTCSDAGLRCRISALPFESSVFDLVVLHLYETGTYQQLYRNWFVGAGAGIHGGEAIE